MPTQLTYAIRTTPDPLTAGAADASLTLLATNETDKPIPLEGISISIPVGTEADDLTDLPDQIVADFPEGWKENPPNKSQPGVYKVVFIPAAGSMAQYEESTLALPAQKSLFERLLTISLRLLSSLLGRSRKVQEDQIDGSLVVAESTQPTVSVPANGSLTFVLNKVAVNSNAGTVDLTITEGTVRQPTESLPVSKFPANWGSITFSVTPPVLPTAGDVSLKWNGPSGATYMIEYLDPSTQKPVSIPRSGQPPLGNSGTYPGSSDPKLNITATTLFTLTVSKVIGGKTFTFQPQQTVTVGVVPTIASFTGKLEGDGTERKLLLNWKTTDTDYVTASWTDEELDANPPQPYTISPPFGKTYAITAHAGHGPKSKPAVLQQDYTLSDTIPVGETPYNVAITPDGTLGLVANISSCSVSVIDLKERKVIYTISIEKTDRGLGGLAITPDGNLAFVGNFNERISVINIKERKVIKKITIKGQRGAPWIAITPDGKLAFVMSYTKQRVSVIDTQKQTLSHTIPILDDVYGVAITPDGNLAFVGTAGGVTVIDVKTMKISNGISLEDGAKKVAITPDGTLAFVTNNEAKSVVVIDIKKQTVSKTIPVGMATFPIGITSNGNYALVGANNANKVVLIDIEKLAVVSIIVCPGSYGLKGLAITPDDSLVFLAPVGNDSTVGLLQQEYKLVSS